MSIYIGIQLHVVNLPGLCDKLLLYQRGAFGGNKKSDVPLQGLSLTPQPPWKLYGNSSLHNMNYLMYLPLTFHSHFKTHNTCHYSICRKRFEKGFLAEIYHLYASVPLLMYFFLISSQFIKNFKRWSDFFQTKKLKNKSQLLKKWKN